jgi:hypothetical protein
LKASRRNLNEGVITMEPIPDTVTEFLAALDHVQASDPVLLTWHHPRFGAFVRAWVHGRVRIPGRTNEHDFELARRVLQQMGGFDVWRSLAWLGGYCGAGGRDVCSLLAFWCEGPNGIRSWEDEARRQERVDPEGSVW